MKPEAKFLKMYYKLPEKAKRELIINYPENPMTLDCLWVEVKSNTELAKKMLEKLGYIQ